MTSRMTRLVERGKKDRPYRGIVDRGSGIGRKMKCHVHG